MPLSKEKKAAYFVTLDRLLNQYSRMFIVSANNVGSNQMANVRKELRGKAEVLMGKNTMMRRGIKTFLSANPGHPWAAILPLVQGNIGFIFTDSDLIEIRDVIVSNVVPAPARVGAFAPVDVWVPKGPTGCDPGQTSFFQALNIGTKIAKGQIEIITDEHLLSVGDKVEPGHAALLQKLGINPFSYGLIVESVYDNGSVFNPAILDLTDDDLASKFIAGCRKVAAVSLALSMPTLASLRFSIASTFAKVLGVSVITGVNCKSTQPWHDYLADPEKFAAAAAAAAGSSGGAAAEAVEEEEEEEEAVQVGAGGLFGDDDGGDY